MNNVVINRAMYLAWLRNNFPQLYEDALTNVRNDYEQQQISGFFDSVKNAFSNVVDSVTKNLPQLAQTYTQYEAQKDLLKVNTDRARQGMAPLQYNAQGQLVTATGLPYSAEDYQLAQRAGTGMDSMTLWVIVGGFVLLLGIMLSNRGNSRR